MVCTYYRAFHVPCLHRRFFTLSYSPLKAIIQGTPKALWPAPMTKLNAVGMPTTAMWLQCLLVSLFILLVSFGGDTASAFYNKLTLMANVSMTLPYLFWRWRFRSLNPVRVWKGRLLSLKPERRRCWQREWSCWW